MTEHTVAVNRRARHDYAIEDTLEAGLVLTGTEIKSVRAHKVNIAEAYVRIERGEAWLIGAHIAETPSPLTSCPGYDVPAGLPLIVSLGYTAEEIAELARQEERPVLPGADARLVSRGLDHDGRRQHGENANGVVVDGRRVVPRGLGQFRFDLQTARLEAVPEHLVIVREARAEP